MIGEKTMNNYQDIHSHWNSRAKLGQAAGTRDLILKQLEIEAISNYVRPRMRILDAGCGNGITAMEIAGKHNVHIEGFDYAEDMIREAKKTAAEKQLKGTVDFHVADIKAMPKNFPKFNMIYTERVLINLQNWSEQEEAIKNLCSLLMDGGHYVMCENSQNGLQKINLFRECLGLSQITPPWHNRYLLDAEIEQLSIPGIQLETVDHFTSTYYFLSRIINSGLAAQENSEPDYNAPVNQLALRLPPIGKLGQTRIWLWRKKGHID